VFSLVRSSGFHFPITSMLTSTSRRTVSAEDWILEN
jgi:hypothetical protein